MNPGRFPRKAIEVACLVTLLMIPLISQAQHAKHKNTQALSTLDSLEKVANYYSENHPEEKVYIHFDKSFYLIGEDSWFKAYVVNESQLSPTDISRVLYVDWIAPSGKIVKQHRLKIENGGAAGSTAIDSAFSEGTYTVRAYTNWMRNEDPGLFYSKKIQVLDLFAMQPVSSDSTVKRRIDLQFFPEGGTLVAGIKTQIAFKAVDHNGMGVDIKGNIVDEQNKFVAAFRSVHKGMGVFPFIADINRSYHAVLQNGETFPLPAPSPEGLVLGTSNLNADKIFVRIQTGKKNRSSFAYLIGRSRGTVCYAAYIRTDSIHKNISIPKDKLPEGVLQLTLFDHNRIPVCERMVFIKKENPLSVSIKSDKEHYKPRDSVMLNFSIHDIKGKPVETSLSVSVTDAGLIHHDRNSENIYTRLLLQSDIRGNVEDPGWYFDSQTSERTYALDLVMLTHGWSRYNWKNILKPSQDSIRFLPEKGIALQGRILSGKKPVPNAPFMLLIAPAEKKNINIYESDSLGYFTVPDLDFSDSTAISWRIMKRKGMYQHAKVTLNETSVPPPAVALNSQHGILPVIRNNSHEKVVNRFIRTGAWDPDKFRMLNEVVVTAKKILKTDGFGNLFVKPTPEDLKSATPQLVSRFALGISGAKFIPGEDPGTGVWVTPFGGPIVIAIDGFTPEENEFPVNPYVVLSTIAPDEIDYFIVGGNAHDGYFIYIRTKTSTEVLGEITHIVNGYDVFRDFYHPKYGPKDIPVTLPDNRMTLYWNSDLKTDKDGTATVKFYNTDSTQKFLIVAEGITNGFTISTVQTVGRVD